MSGNSGVFSGSLHICGLTVIVVVILHNISGALAAKVYSHANNLHNNPKP